MLITIDTNNITDADRAVLALVLEGYDGKVTTIEQPVAAEPDKPKRTRRTKAQIAADEAAAAAFSPDDTADNAGKPGVKEESGITVDNGDGPKPISDTDAEIVAEVTDATDEQNVTIDEVTELATKFIAADRPGMVELLKQFGARKVSEIPESDLGTFANEIRAKLAKLA